MKQTPTHTPASLTAEAIEAASLLLTGSARDWTQRLPADMREAATSELEAVIATVEGARAGQDDDKPDPAAVFAIAHSLDAFAQASVHVYRDQISDVYSGHNGFMRAIMRAGERFETWASDAVDFDRLPDVWPYLLQDGFAQALEAVMPGSILELDELHSEDWPDVWRAIAERMGCVIKNDTQHEGGK